MGLQRVRHDSATKQKAMDVVCWNSNQESSLLLPKDWILMQTRPIWDPLHHGPLHGILNLNWILNRRTMILKVWIVGFPSHIAKFLDHTVLHMWFHCNSCFLAFHSFYKPPSTCLWFKLAELLSIAYNYRTLMSITIVHSDVPIYCINTSTTSFPKCFFNS